MAGSPYFHAMFATEMSEHGKDVITIGGVTSVVFQTLLDFIYSGKITRALCKSKVIVHIYRLYTVKFL